ncbi:hypothetical protein GAB14E_4007 [Colwellia psychrerythraea]|uniref:Uncharacterized protein n=2 Tax=Colwellia psychrerythraea TaxID=28229 RepID=A0A099KF79_COLPS|nr:hypothetical protein GAB14E_4007 [Colwellia psychrerythraea]
MRSLIIAKALKIRWPNISIHFILNKQVSYFNDCPYIVHGCQNSPTKDTATVNRIIEQVSPNLVIFDASGRAAQFKKAKATGAKVAFISQHNKKRSRGLKLNRLASTDIHWVAQPDYCIKPISLWQRVKLALFNKKAPKNLGPVFELSSDEYQAKLLVRYDLVRENYLVFNAGSGGHLVSGKLAADIYYQAAQEFYLQTGIQCIVIFGDNYPKELPENNDIICIKSITNKDFISLIIAAQACVISAGDTLLQCITLHKPCVAAPVSPDQPMRLKLCQAKRLVLAAAPLSESLVLQAKRLITQNERQALLNNMAKQAPLNALELIVEDIASLFTFDQKTQ